jgi:hypothetical protein
VSPRPQRLRAFFRAHASPWLVVFRAHEVSASNTLPQRCFQGLFVQYSIVTDAVDEESRRAVHSAAHAAHEVALHAIAKLTGSNILLESRLPLPPRPFLRKDAFR